MREAAIASLLCCINIYGRNDTMPDCGKDCSSCCGHRKLITVEDLKQSFLEQVTAIRQVIAAAADQSEEDTIAFLNRVEAAIERC
jgi:hypothetical protein